MGRLKSEAKAPELVKYVMAPFLADMDQYFDAHLRIHKAHVVMLVEQALISKAEGASILSALRAMQAVGKDGLHLHHDTDLYMQMEAFVLNRAPEAGGKMHMGRSRNDLYACGARLLTRERLLTVISDLLSLQNEILLQASRHTSTVMPGYTHLQHAEPITLGHFLLAFHDALSRDLTRLGAAFSSTNQNALGSSALAGSSFPLDRERTATLLGFDSVVENSYDAVASRDYLVESLAALAVMASSITRVVDTWILWCTTEFAMLDMPDSYGYTSSIMPQKRNPGYFLESVRCKAARITGDMSSALCTLKGTTFAQSRDTSFEITIAVFRSFNEADGIVNVMRGIVSSMIIKPDVMKKNCESEFSGATEIANTLVRSRGLDFRSAYTIVANTVRLAAEQSLAPKEITSVLLDAAAQDVIGAPAGLSDAQIQTALAPDKNVELKRTTGSPAKREVQRMLALRKASHLDAINLQASRLAQLEQADVLLEKTIDTLLLPA